MTREEAEEYAKTMTYEDALYNLSRARAIPYRKATLIKVNELIKALSQEPTDEMVHVETLRQVMWERDIAIGQLKELGYSFGQKIEPCDDAISREDAFEIIASNDTTDGTEPIFTGRQVVALLSNLPSVTQKSGKWQRVSYERRERMRNLCDECNKRDVCRMRDNGVSTCVAFTPTDKDSRKAFNNGYRCCEEDIEKMKDEVEAEYKSFLCNEAYSDITYGLKIALDIIEHYARGESEDKE